MGFLNKWFGGGNVEKSQGGGAIDGGHNLNKSTVLAPTDANVITPANADFTSIRTAPVVTKPRRFNKTEAAALKALEKQCVETADATEQAYGSLKTIEGSDGRVHEAHRSYQKKVAKVELKKKESDADLAKTLHGLRPKYAELGMGLDVAEKGASDQIAAIKAAYGVTV